MTFYLKSANVKGMSEFSKSKPESNVKGNLVQHAAKLASQAAMRESFLHGRRRDVPEAYVEGAPKLIPEDYDMPDNVREVVESRETAAGSSPLEDPSGIIAPGPILTSPADPDHRRLVTNMYTTPRGKGIVAVHIEGETGLRNLTLEDLHGRINDGRVQLPPAESH